MYFLFTNTWQPLYFLLYYFLLGGIAQLVRAHGSHPWGREFESPCLHHIGASFVSLAPIFYHNQSALTPLLLLFYKKSRAAHLVRLWRLSKSPAPLERFAVATTFRAFARATPAVKMPKVSFYAISHRLDPEPNALPVLILLTQCMKFFCDAAYETFAALARAVGVATVETDDKTAANHFVKALHDIAKQWAFPRVPNTGETKNFLCCQSNGRWCTGIGKSVKHHQKSDKSRYRGDIRKTVFIRF